MKASHRAAVAALVAYSSITAISAAQEYDLHSRTDRPYVSSPSPCASPEWTSVTEETTATIARSVAAKLPASLPDGGDLARNVAVLLEHGHSPSADSFLECTMGDTRPMTPEIASVLRTLGGNGGNDPKSRSEDIDLLLQALSTEAASRGDAGFATLRAICEESIQVVMNDYKSLAELQKDLGRHRSTVSESEGSGTSAFDWRAELATAKQGAGYRVATVQMHFRSSILAGAGESEKVGDAKIWYLHSKERRRWVPIHVSVKGLIPIIVLF